jgi:hypothetical protein
LARHLLRPGRDSRGREQGKGAMIGIVEIVD